MDNSTLLWMHFWLYFCLTVHKKLIILFLSNIKHLSSAGENGTRFSLRIRVGSASSINERSKERMEQFARPEATIAGTTACKAMAHGHLPGDRA
jgi:hypothetical protein